MPTLFKMSDDKKTEDMQAVVFTQVSNMKRKDIVTIKINLCLTCLSLSYCDMSDFFICFNYYNIK